MLLLQTGRGGEGGQGRPPRILRFTSRRTATDAMKHAIANQAVYVNHVTLRPRASLRSSPRSRGIHVVLHLAPMARIFRYTLSCGEKEHEKLGNSWDGGEED